MNHTLFASINLVAMLLFSSFLAGAIAQANWRRAGAGAVIFWIILAGQAWLIPQAVSVFFFESTELLYVLWFGNWIASAVAVIIFALTFRGTSSHLLDAARMDGSGFFGIFRNVVWPTAKPALGALTIILFMATWMEFLRPVFPVSGNSILPVGFPAWSVPMTNPEIALLLATSFLATLPIIAIYFARRCFFEKAVLH
ncbi:MAG: hypothetical protein ABIR21_05145 [Chthoniobacterales bacterium]